MSNLVSSLREANNFVVVEGVLKENNLEKKTENEGTDNQKTFIRGNIIISVSDQEEYKIHYYANEFTSTGSESKAFKGLETVMKEYVSLAQAIADGKDASEATKVNVKAKFGINDFYSTEKNQMYSTVQLRANYVSRVTGEFKPRAEFDVECYFQSIEEEKDANGVSTGRVKVEGIVPIYQGAVIPITFFSTEDKTYGDIGQYLLQNYKAGKTGAIGGHISCKIVSNTTQVQGFGAPVERTFNNYVYENIIERGGAEQYLITDPKNFDKNTIKSAMLFRQEQLEKKKAEALANSTSSSESFDQPTTSTTFGNTNIDTTKVKELDF